MASSLTTSTARDCVPRRVQHQRASRSRRCRPFAVVAALLLIAVFAAGCDWLQPGFDGGQSYFNPSEPALTASTVGSLTKQFSVQFPVNSSGPIVVDGKIVVSGHDPSGNLTVSAADAKTGASAWSVTPLEPTFYETGVTSDGTNIYVATQLQDQDPISGGDGTTHVIALSPATGATVWDVALPGAPGSGAPGSGYSLGKVFQTPVVAGGRLFLPRAVHTSGSSGSFEWTALDTATRSTLWTYDTPLEPCPCLLAGTTATAGNSVAVNGGVILNAADGSVKWSTGSLPAGQSAFLYQGGNGLFFGPYSPDGTTSYLAAFDSNTGAIKWATPEAGDVGGGGAITDDLVIHSGGAITDNLVILSDSDPLNPNNFRLEALDIQTGRVDGCEPCPRAR